MRLRKNNKRLSELRRRWGHGRNELAHPQNEAYAALRLRNTGQPLSDQTLNDLDFPALFSFLDHTHSRVGQQYLYGSTFIILKRPSGKTDYLSITC